jgi:acetoacetyl-CoA synthetase
MLATASLGAIFTSASPDFGVQGVLDRFGQTEPKVLFTVDGYWYHGKAIDIRGKVAEVVAGLPSVRRVVVTPYLEALPDLSMIDRAQGWAEFTAPQRDATEIDFVRLPFDHPLYILYSSGTTGMPKCIVHCAGGVLLQHLKEHKLHGDVKPDDRLFYFTTCGWMMWNWLVSGLASEATLLLYDGSPFVKDGAILFDYADAERMTHFGTSAKFLDAAAKKGLAPIETHRLDTVRTMFSTGSPLMPEGFEYVYTRIKRDLCLSSISGGTDIVSCFVLGNPTLPVWRGEIQCKGLGMAVQVFDEEGHPVVGQKGELVCTRPFPVMPLGFWNDPDGSKYRAAYFERFPGVWCHGDYCEETIHGGFIIYGRSDATLNPGGVRIGTAEIYRQVEKLPEVEESIVIGQDWQGDVRVVLFVRLREGLVLDDDLQEKIRRVIRDNTTPRHVPAKIVQVPDIPRTKSGKIVELAVRQVVHGQPVRNVEALANPEALEYFRDRAELKE